MIFVLLPVFNRIQMTRRVLECLRAQCLDEHLRIIVIDDGSTDGTGYFLSEQKDITVLVGDGSLWWGGAIELGLQYVLGQADEADSVLMVNNDTAFSDDFVQELLDTARAQAPAAVGSVIRDEQPPHRLLSVGAQIDAWKLLVRDRFDGIDKAAAPEDSCEAVEVDALSGRGVLFPVSALKKVNGMRPRWLPHYLADYELSLRLRSAGCRLLVAPGAAVYSKEEYGNAYRASSLKDKLFSVRSPAYLPAVVIFWWEASNWLQRLTFPLRIALFKLFPGFRKKL